MSYAHNYRKGILYFYNNTVISTRDGNTTLLNMSTNDEAASVFNNVIYTTAPGNNLAMINNNGTFNMRNNWLKPDWQDCHCSPMGTIVDYGGNIVGDDPLFTDFVGQDFRLTNSSELIDAGDVIPAFLIAEYNVTEEYVEHQNSAWRSINGILDIGAFENVFGLGIENNSNQLDFTLTPNPVQNILTIHSFNTFARVLIYNHKGQLIKVVNTSQVDVSELVQGLYFVSGVSNNGTTHFGKFVKI